MSDQDKEAPKGDLLPALRIMAKLCGLRDDFLADLLLLESDEWSFVVKAHALLESVVCQLLATHLKKPPLEFVFAQRVQMEDRIEILKTMEVTTSKQRQMMRLLGKLRNNLVHNAQQTDFKFAEYFKNRDNRRNFADSFGTSWPEQIPNSNPPQSRVDFVLRNPKYAIWMSVIEIVSLSLDAKVKAALEEQQRMVMDSLQTAINQTSDKPSD